MTIDINNTLAESNNINVLFRFLSLNKMQSFTLKKELFDVTTTEVELNKLYTGLVPLTELNFDDIIDFYIKQQLSIEQCDISILVKSSNHGQSYPIPNIVSKMLKHLECSLSVSVSAFNLQLSKASK